MQVLAHYHEIALKGRNRPFFVDRLARNLRAVLADVPGVQVHVLAGRLMVTVPDELDWDSLRARLATVFGLVNFARAVALPLELDALGQAALDAVAGRRFESFRVRTKRSYKGFPLKSMEIDRAIGGRLHAATGVRVDLEAPELTVFIEVLKDRFLLSTEKQAGAGGFPVGSSGRVLTLLSGGIDSPVAACRMLRRGCKSLLVHFHAFPLQDRTTIDKARELARILTRYQYRTRLLLVPFATLQQTIVASCPAPLRVVLYRRFMLRIAEALAHRFRAKALVTGESLGQVASQTLDNLAVIDAAATLPVLRPLVGMDKQEITAEARRIGSFETSTLPDQDCCQLFVPRSPATAATLEQVQAAEALLPVGELVAAALEGVESERFGFPPARDLAPAALAS